MSIDHPLPSFPPRPAEGHKGTFGTVTVIGGQCSDARTMIGGPAFTASAALRAGAGLAVLAMPAPVINAGLTVAPSATGIALPVDGHDRLIPSEVASIMDAHLPTTTCLAVGPGLGTHETVRRIVMRLLTRHGFPMVLDADALNVMADSVDLQSDMRCHAVLTPHPGEYRRLAGPLSIDLSPTAPDERRAAAEAMAQRLGCVVVLKGARTVVTDGQRTYIDPTSNPALATAGSGDVLTGIIAGLIAQACAMHAGLDLLDCAALGVHLHAQAAARWSNRHGDAGLLASDLIDAIRPDGLH